MAINESFLTAGQERIREIMAALETQQYRELMTYYRCAMMEMETKLNVLNEEFSMVHDRNPIESVKSRLKSPESIAGKLEHRNLEPTIENLENEITDIAGVRVICSYASDIYMLADALLAQDDVRLIIRKDYIAKPKSNGYRSLHLIVETPIFLYNQKKLMKVEIQLRTLSMDWWASLEHKISYKKDLTPETLQLISTDLLNCAEMASRLDARMEAISRKINGE